jgi:hypothetical protein
MLKHKNIWSIEYDKKAKSRTEFIGERYYFFLNTYKDMAFTHCPKCEGKTKIRKHCLLIHIDPNYYLSLNKSCRYCPYCDLIIVKQTDLEGQLTAICEQYALDIIGNEYFVFGTMDRRDWKDAKIGKIAHDKVLERAYSFKDIWKFEVHPGGWHFENG